MLPDFTIDEAPNKLEAEPPKQVWRNLLLNTFGGSYRCTRCREILQPGRLAFSCVAHASYEEAVTSYRAVQHRNPPYQLQWLGAYEVGK